MPRTSERVSVLVIDDHRMFQEGLLAVLDGAGEFVVQGSAYSVEEARAAVENGVPDVAIVDLKLPDGSGTDVMRHCAENHPDCAIVALSVHSEVERVYDAFAAGARAYVNKSSATRSLLEAIRAVRRGELFCDGVTTRALVEGMGWTVGHRIADSKYALLSERERQVFVRIAAGQGTKEIARELEVSPKTIETHRTNIYQKLDVWSPVEIARYAARIGLP